MRKTKNKSKKKKRKKGGTGLEKKGKRFTLKSINCNDIKSQFSISAACVTAGKKSWVNESTSFSYQGNCTLTYETFYSFWPNRHGVKVGPGAQDLKI